MLHPELQIQTLPSLAPFLETEIRALGYEPLQTSRNGVTVRGDWEEVLHLNLHLRTASHVFWLVEAFEADDADQLYRAAVQIEWHRMIPKSGYVSIHSHVKNDSIRDFRFANLKLKDAIVDQMQLANGARPDSGKELDQTVVYLYWSGNQVRLYLDTSGETIAKHGYRRIPHKAPMIEALAAACLVAAGWPKPGWHLINPMCGSGTLAIEGALMAAGIPPGLRRENFGFMHLRGYEPGEWRDLLREVRPRQRLEQRIIATDHDGRALRATLANAQAAGVGQMIETIKLPFEETPIPEGDGLVILNPEYGERMGEEAELEAVYRGIGDFFKQSCTGKMGYVFTGNPLLAKQIGLKTSRRYEMRNAKIECRLLAYELYQGSRRPKATED